MQGLKTQAMEALIMSLVAW